MFPEGVRHSKRKKETVNEVEVQGKLNKEQGTWEQSSLQ
jgi:hypothetical protein